MKEFVDSITKRDERIEQAKARAVAMLEKFNREWGTMDNHEMKNLREIVSLSVECGVQAALGYRETFEIEAANA